MANQFGCFEFNDNIIKRDNNIFTVEEFIDYYITTNHSAKETCIKFKFSGRILQKIMKHYNLTKPAKLSHEINKKTCLKKYGDPTYNNQKQTKQTNLEKYGCENVFQAKQIKEISCSTKLKKYGDKHYVNSKQAKKTCLEKYGYANTNQVPMFKEKKKQTCLKHFGVEFPMQSKIVQSKYNFEQLAQKAFETKKKNGTTNSSKIQEWFTDELRQIYGTDDVLTEYKEARYPFHCDVYIKSKDQFLELNIYFTHGEHPYNKNNIDDTKKLKLWEDKAKQSKFFQNAINVWTVTDPLKQQFALKNNLNYKTFYSCSEIYEYINTLKENTK